MCASLNRYFNRCFCRCIKSAAISYLRQIKRDSVQKHPDHFQCSTVKPNSKLIGENTLKFCVINTAKWWIKCSLFSSIPIFLIRISLPSWNNQEFKYQAPLSLAMISTSTMETPHITISVQRTQKAHVIALHTFTFLVKWEMCQTKWLQFDLTDDKIENVGLVKGWNGFNEFLVKLTYSFISLSFYQ